MALGYVSELYDCTLPHLLVQDLTSEVRQEVLSTLACIIEGSADTDGELIGVLMPKKDAHSGLSPFSLTGLLKAALDEAQSTRLSLLIPYSSLIIAAIHAYPHEMR